MRDPKHWKPTKFVRTKRGLRGSRDPHQVGVASRFITDIIAQHYERVIRSHANGRLLDLGCGHVPLYETYRDLVRDNVCVDWQRSPHASPYLDLIVDLNERLPFEDSLFDTVLLTDVLEHISEPMQLMCEIARLLRPGGKLILGVPFLYWLHEVPHDYYRYTEYTLRRFCRRCGLTINEIEPYGGLPEVLIDLTSKGLELFPRPLAWFLRLAHTSLSMLSNNLVCRKLSEWSKREYPLGYVLVAQKAGVRG